MGDLGVKGRWAVVGFPVGDSLYVAGQSSKGFFGV
jgi:hypothetical protein